MLVGASAVFTLVFARFQAEGALAILLENAGEIYRSSCECENLPIHASETL